MEINLKKNAITVLYVVPSADFGGAETFLASIAQGHHRESIHPIFCLLRNGPLLEHLTQQGHVVYLAPCIPQLRNPWRCLRVLFWLTTLIRKTRAQIVHSTLAYGALFGASAGFLTRTPHVWFQHGPVTGWMDLLAELLRCEWILVNSHHTEIRQKSLASWFKKNLRIQRHTQILYPSINLTSWLPRTNPIEIRKKIRSEWKVQDSDFLIGVICRPQPQKGLHFFVEALKLLPHSSPTGRNVIGVIVGGSATESTWSLYEREIHRLIESMGSSMRWIPFTSTTESVITALDAIVCTSISPEGFGLTLIEGMALKKPVIAPNEGGPVEIVQHEKNGLLYPARDAFELAQKIRLLAENPDWCSQLGEEGLKTVQTRFLFKNMIHQLETLYHLIIDKS